MGVSRNFLDILKFVFVDLWHLFTDFCIPGTNVTFASWAVASLVLVKVIQIIRTLYGVYSIGESEERHGKGGKKS